MDPIDFEDLMGANVYIRFTDDSSAISMPNFNVVMNGSGSCVIVQDENDVWSSKEGRNIVFVRFPGNEWVIDDGGMLVRTSVATFESVTIRVNMDRCWLYDRFNGNIQLELVAISIDCDKDTICYVDREIYASLVAE